MATKVKYSATTGKKLKAGEKTTDAKGNTYTQGQTFSGGSKNSNRVDFDAKTGQLLSKGATTTDSLGNVSTQGQEYKPTKFISGTEIGKTTEGIKTYDEFQPTMNYNALTPQQIAVLTPEEKKLSLENQRTTDFEALVTKMVAPESDEKIYNKTLQESGKIEAQQKVNQLTEQLNTIVSNGQAGQIALTGQGRGIPTGILGGQAAEIARQTAIDSLPVSAQLAAAQGNLEMATENLNTLFSIRSADAKAKYNYKTTMLKTLYDFADKTTQTKLDEVNKQIDRKYEEEKKDRAMAQEIAIEAAKNGASASTLKAITEAKDFSSALSAAGSSIATSQNEIVKLDNGSTLLVNKRTGAVVKNFGGGKSTGNTPSTIVRTVAGTPVTGYTVTAGDDNNIIAQLYGTDINTIKKLNPSIKDWNNLQIGQVLNVPQADKDTFVQLLKSTEGGKNLTDTSIQKLDKGLTVLGQLGVLQSNVENVKTGPIVGYFKEKNPWDTKGQTIKASLNAIIPNLARGVYGEVGVLTDNDIKQYAKTIPNLQSTEEVRNAVLYITLDMIGKSIKNTLSVNAASGRDVSGFVDIYTEMEDTKNSILSGIPSAQTPQAFQSQDDFLNQFSPQAVDSSISNSNFFNQFSWTK